MYSRAVFTRQAIGQHSGVCEWEMLLGYS